MADRIRLEPMSEAQFQESLEQGIVRLAAEMTRRGHWTEAESRESARSEFAQMLPEGGRTANRRFRIIVDAESGRRVGETWCTVRPYGGKVQYWVDWLGIDAPYRRQGFGRAALRALAEEVSREGADRIGLSVISDNGPARALYEQMGFRDETRRMILRFREPPRRRRHRRGRGPMRLSGFEPE